MAFVLDTFLGWVMQTIATAADAEMHDDRALRERLLEAEMQRETGEISDARFAEIEKDLLARIREIKARREGAGPLAFESGEAIERGADQRFHVEASLAGEFHAPRETAKHADGGVNRTTHTRGITRKHPMKKPRM
jgi:hypothetical protein